MSTLNFILYFLSGNPGDPSVFPYSELVKWTWILQHEPRGAGSRFEAALRDEPRSEDG